MTARESTTAANGALVFLVLASALVLGGCAPMIRNEANTGCHRRVQSDAARCVRNNRSNEQAVAARYGSPDKATKAWAARTLQQLEAEAGR